ncbi:MAG TPA: ROK family protein [Tepidisphaeraceae bacterium]|nr:ROK family protein [Tepidisphaeraceae bacterium]
MALRQAQGRRQIAAEAGFADDSSQMESAIALGIDIGGTTVKAAAVRDAQVVWAARSRPYARPDAAGLIRAMGDATSRLDGKAQYVGLCVPGLLDERRERITYSANVPGLHEISLHELVRRALGAKAPAPVVVNDATATAFDIFSTRRLAGRLLVLALGGGVGAAVLDDGKPLHVEGDSAGHLGQIDVSIGDDPPIAPDGGRGGLEGYLGAAALAARYGDDPASKISPADPAFLALARAIRICHAIYRPRHVCLAGGTGIRLGRLLAGLRDAVATQLTSVARADWTLSCGDSDFHAAAGAARIAGSSDWG